MLVRYPAASVQSHEGISIWNQYPKEVLRASYNNADLGVSSDSALRDSWKSFHDTERFYAFFMLSSINL